MSDIIHFLSESYISMTLVMLSWMKYVLVSGVDLLSCELEFENETGFVVCFLALICRTAAPLSQKFQNKKFRIHLFEWCFNFIFENFGILILENANLNLRKPLCSKVTHLRTLFCCFLYATSIMLLAYICLAPLVVILYLLFWLGISLSAVDVFSEFPILMSQKISSKFSKYAYYNQSAGFVSKRGGVSGREKTKKFGEKISENSEIFSMAG